MRLGADSIRARNGTHRGVPISCRPRSWRPNAALRRVRRSVAARGSLDLDLLYGLAPGLALGDGDRQLAVPAVGLHAVGVDLYRQRDGPVERAAVGLHQVIVFLLFL